MTLASTPRDTARWKLFLHTAREKGYIKDAALGALAQKTPASRETKHYVEAKDFHLQLAPTRVRRARNRPWLSVMYSGISARLLASVTGEFRPQHVAEAWKQVWIRN
jgi:hypothetical protein